MKYIRLSTGDIATVDNADFNWLNQWNWHLSGAGYAMRSELGKSIYMHTLLSNGPKGMDTDHVDGNRLNNSRSNLRVCTRSQNMMNARKQSNNTSGYKGVSWQKNAKKFSAYIQVGGKKKHLGLFTNAIEAAKAYNNAALDHFGGYCRLNKFKEY